MKSAKSPGSSWLWFGAALVLFGYVFGSPLPASAQTYPPCAMGQGFNAAYGECTNGSPNGSFALIDASQYMNQGDICAAIHAIFANYNGNVSYGIVVDARGFNPHPGIPQGCTTNPWANLTTLPYSSVVLLPPGTITLSTKWTLPSYTSVVGQGPNVTIIQAGSGFSFEMIDMGTSAICPETFADCPSVQIEHLGVNGNNIPGVSGIQNWFSQEKSWVNDVAFTNLAGIALDIEKSTAFNSGPYTNLSMSNVGTCLQIKAFPTRGVHGLTCSTTGSSGPAIYLDGINNSLEDIYIQGGSSQDGILVGSQAAAGNNLLFNVSGSGLANVIHLSSNSTSGVPNVSDVTILGVARSGGTSTIKDDLVNKTIGDTTVGMYVIGEPIQGNNANIGYSRFTTSTSRNAATWLVGPNSPVGSGSCATGDLFSQTTVGTPSGTLWGCGGGQWFLIK